jgi:transitional endoplasmic reticulum ATPase
MIFSRARAEAPCVLILEDLDSLITDMNRSFFLNEVDGLEDNDGLLLVSAAREVKSRDDSGEKQVEWQAQTQTRSSRVE